MLVVAARTVSIASLMLLTLLVAICSAILLANPLTGIITTVVCMTALCRTALFVTYAKSNGCQLSIGAKLIAFFQSTLLVAVIGLSTTTAFSAVCFPTALATQNFWFGTFAGTIAAICACCAVLFCFPVYESRFRQGK